MELAANEPSAGCSGHCERCPAGSEEERTEPRMSGWRFALSAFVVFLIPLALAITGAVLWRDNQTAQLAGALAGFAVGVLAAKGITRLIRPPEGRK